MKVLAIVNGNGSIHTLRPEIEQFIELHELGIDVDICIQKESVYTPIIEENGINRVGTFPDNKRDKETTAQIRQLLIKNKYDIVHVLNRISIACTLKAVKGLPTKVVTYRGAFGLYWHDPSAYENALNPRVDKVICVCKSIENDIRKQLFFKKEKAITVNKGHRMEWYKDIVASDRKKFNLSEDDFVIACSANNRKSKGIPVLLDAIDLLPPDNNIHILLIGSGMDTSYYQDKISKNKNKDRIHVLGFRDDALPIVKMSDIIMQTSIKHEGLSRSTIEGMALGCVPVVTDAGGNPELVINNECGLVVPQNDPQAMIDAILQLYKSPSKMQELKEAAYDRIKDNFTVRKTAEETLAVYKNLLT